MANTATRTEDKYVRHMVVKHPLTPSLLENTLDEHINSGWKLVNITAIPPSRLDSESVCIVFSKIGPPPVEDGE